MHLILVLIQFGFIPVPIGFGRYMGCFKILNMGFVLIVPSMHMIIAMKGTRSDAIYINACIASGIVSIVTMALGVVLRQEVHHIILFDISGIAVYYLLKRKIESFSNSKWLSMYGNENEQE